METRAEEHLDYALRLDAVEACGLSGMMLRPQVRSALTVKTMAPDVGITSMSTEGIPKPARGRPPQPESNPTNL